MKISVGGQIFEINETSIKKYHQETLLSKMMKYENNEIIVKDNGILTIDRDPKFFHLILELYDNPISKYCDHIDTMKDDVECVEQYYDDLLYYGFLPQLSEPVKKISVRQFESNMKDKICEKFMNEKHNPTELYHNLMKFIKTMDGHIAGSFALECYLNEEWTGNDIDIYVNKSILQYLIANTYGYKKNHDIKIEKNVVTKFLRTNLCNEIDDVVINNTKINHDNIYIMDDGYGLCCYFDSVIKFKYYGLNIDIVVVTCTPKHFLAQFDFDFCKLYYDGHNLNSFGWQSLFDRTCENKYAYDRYNITEMYKYTKNIKRIKKYVERGFNILCASQFTPQKSFYIDEYTVCSNECDIDTELQDEENNIDENE